MNLQGSENSKRSDLQFNDKTGMQKPPDFMHISAPKKQQVHVQPFSFSKISQPGFISFAQLIDLLYLYTFFNLMHLESLINLWTVSEIILSFAEIAPTIRGHFIMISNQNHIARLGVKFHEARLFLCLSFLHQPFHLHTSYAHEES